MCLKKEDQKPEFLRCIIQNIQFSSTTTTTKIGDMERNRKILPIIRKTNKVKIKNVHEYDYILKSKTSKYLLQTYSINFKKAKQKHD